MSKLWDKEFKSEKMIKIQESMRPKELSISITFDDEGSYIVPYNKDGLDLVRSELETLLYTDPGTSYTIEVIEMSEEERRDLPEFTGW